MKGLFVLVVLAMALAVARASNSSSSNSSSAPAPTPSSSSSNATTPTPAPTPSSSSSNATTPTPTPASSSTASSSGSPSAAAAAASGSSSSSAAAAASSSGSSSPAAAAASSSGSGSSSAAAPTASSSSGNGTTPTPTPAASSSSGNATTPSSSAPTPAPTPPPPGATITQKVTFKHLSQMPTGTTLTAYEQGYATQIGANKTQCPTCTVKMSAARRALNVKFIAKITAALKASATAASTAIVSNPGLLAAAINAAAVSAGIAGWTPLVAANMTASLPEVVDDVTSSSSSKTKLIIGLVVGIGGFVLLVAIGAAIYMCMKSGGEQSCEGHSGYDKQDASQPSTQLGAAAPGHAPMPSTQQSHDGGRACC